MLLETPGGCLGLLLSPFLWIFETLICEWLVRRIFAPVAVVLMRVLTFGVVKLDPESTEATVYGVVLLIAVVVLITVAGFR